MNIFNKLFNKPERFTKYSPEFKEAIGRLAEKEDQIVRPPIKKRSSINEWVETMNYLKSECQDIRMNICEGCGFAKLYDNNGEVYKTPRYDTLDGTKLLVGKIRAINAAWVDPL